MMHVVKAITGVYEALFHQAYKPCVIGAISSQTYVMYDGGPLNRPRRRYSFWAVLKIQYFSQRAILCCHQNAVAKTSRVQYRLPIIWISIEAHAALQWIPIWRPMLQLVGLSSIEQTWPPGSVKGTTKGLSGVFLPLVMSPLCLWPIHGLPWPLWHISMGRIVRVALQCCWTPGCSLKLAVCSEWGSSLKGTPSYIPIGLWWDYSNETRFVILVEMSSTDPRGGLKLYK